MKKIISFMLSHKIILFITTAVVILGGYYLYSNHSQTSDAVQYITTSAKKETITSSVDGVGQVSASNQIDLQSKASGDLVVMDMTVGQEVKQGDLLAQVDARDAARSVNEAQASLDNAKLDLAQLTAPADNLTLMQAQNAVADTQDSLTKLKLSQDNDYNTTLETKSKAQDNLNTSYEDAYNNIADTFLDLPDIMTGLYNILYSEEISKSEQSVGQINTAVLLNVISHEDSYEFKQYITNADNNYNQAKSDYDANTDVYNTSSRYSDQSDIESLLDKTIDTTKKISDAIKSEINMFDYWVEYATERNFKIYSNIPGYQSNLASYSSKINNHLASLLSASRSIDDYKDNIIAADRSLTEMQQNNPLALAQAQRSLDEKQQQLKDLQEGATELEIKNKQLAVQQKQNALISAQQTYADYFIRAPFDGLIAQVNVSKGDAVSGGTTIATLISNQKIAEITLNEIDAAKVKVGQKSTLTFDALQNEQVSGEVASVDILGSVTQGVVSYNVKIAFSPPSDIIKPGMSVSASIILDSKQDVLAVPVSAVKTFKDQSFVQVLVNGKLQRKNVTVGLANDSMIEITEGVSEGDNIVSQVINGSTSNTNNNSNNQEPNAMRAIRMVQ